jgi:UDP-N-acetylmuramoyl-L-alanyl-D-glutamate--2,6-diaminopimelate ligase
MRLEGMRMQLTELIAGLPVKGLYGPQEIEIRDVVHDSRQVTPGALFVALPGAHVDGHDFLREAFAKGAVAALVQETRGLETENVTLVVVEETDKVLAQVAQVFFDYPARKLQLIGITGTNGKTTSSYLIKSILECAGYRTGLIGTIQNLIGDRSLPTTNTTPGPLELQRVLAEMVREQVEYVVMEVSSHAIALDRIAGLTFVTGLFTNITQDHLDFHKTFDEYLRVKASFFAQLAPSAWAVVNQDDPHAGFILERTVAHRVTFGRTDGAQIYPVDVHFMPTGTNCRVVTPLGQADLALNLAGEFNLMNALGAIGVGMATGIDLATVIRGIQAVTGVPGRFQLVPGSREFGVIIDYAHTPDGLENVLKAAKALHPKRLGVVFGCGGDRDRTKRPIMGRIAEEYADFIWLTSDNPRSEPPEAILDEIEAGLSSGAPFVRISDRREAIRQAVAWAQSGDLLVIAGKGHENYQILADRTIPFDDMKVAAEALEDRRHGRL